MSLSRRQFLKLSAGTLAAAAIADKTLALQAILEMDDPRGDIAGRSGKNKEVTRRDSMETEKLKRFLERTPALKKRAPGLEGIRGRIRFETEDGAAYLLQIGDGEVELTTGGDDAEAIVVCDTEALIVRLLRGEANMIVETLQGHTSARGDLTLVLKVTLGLQAGSPFASREQMPKEHHYERDNQHS